MRTPVRPAGDRLPRSERGSAMLAALCLALVFTISLSSYITLTYQSLTLCTRNLMVAHADEVAEAGLELALYTANYESGWPSWTTSGGANGTATAAFTMTAGGLVLSSAAPTPLNFGNGVNATVVVTVTGTATAAPVFTSTATVTIPNGLSVIQKLTATGSPSPVFVNALAATTGAVNFKYAGSVDSFNSASGPYSAGTAGFAAPVISQYNTSVATVSLSNAQISGFASGYNTSSPNSNNWLSYGGSAKVVGASSGSTYIDSSRVINNPLPYQPQFPESPMGVSNQTSVSLGASQTQSLGVPGTVTTYQLLGDFSVGVGARLTINGPTVLYINGNLNINPAFNDGAEILFNDLPATNQPSLEIHLTGTGGVAGGNVSINGSPNFNLPTMASGATPLPKAFVVCATASSGTVSIGTTSPIYGEFYLPKATITFNNNNLIYGAVVGANLIMNDSPAFHYDIALRSPTTNLNDSAFHAFVAPLSLGAIAESAGP